MGTNNGTKKQERGRLRWRVTIDEGWTCEGGKTIARGEMTEGGGGGGKMEEVH
jgi:hypothetical protein